MKMLLPLVAGLLAVLSCQENSVQGNLSHSFSKDEVQQYENIINKLYRLKQYQEEKQLQEEKRKENEYMQFEEEPVDEDFKDVNLAVETNLQAADPKGLISTTSAPTPKPADDQPPHAPHAPQPQVQSQGSQGSVSGVSAITQNDFVFAAIISACCIAGFVGLIMAGVCWYKLHSRVKAASDVEYPAYGVTGPTKERLPSPGDRKLAQSAQMYHYQHQKQQMIAMEKANGDMKPDQSDEESEEENEEGDYTVYECPGLAPTGEMEVRNPLFNEDAQTPKNGGPASVINGAKDGGEDSQ